MRILGIDYGDRKIGIAVSDAFGWTAQGIETIRYENIEDALSRIKELIGKYKPEKIVVGMPKNMNGSIGFRGEKTIEFVDMLRVFYDSDIITWDERLSTVFAEKLLISADVSRNKRKKVIDTIAAAFILQGYLDLNNK